jgi:SpoVK/Ycf46/Vps4 family AAA+-type ATPase
MKAKITNYIRAGYAGLYIVSPEEQRVEAEIKAIADSVQFDLFFWNAVDGLVNASSGAQNTALDPLEALQAMEEQKEKTITLLKDFHLHLTDPNPILISKLKQVLAVAKTQNKTLIILGCRLCLPPELEREITVIDFSLPNEEQLGIVLDGIIESASLKALAADPREKVINAAKGLTTIEAENAFALSVAEKKSIDAAVVSREKAQALRKNGILEVIETKESLESIGGLDLLKGWLLARKNAFSRQAIEYGLPAPKGVLVMGISGTGKSLSAKATANVFGIPLLKLDAGKIFGSLVGSSEANVRSVIQTAEAIAPCCLWVDELEKALSGTKSSGSTDGGTSARVFGSLLNWLQEKKSPVFVVATANDVSQLPPELLRKGRWDELFFVDLPNEEERRAIWSIQIQKYGRNPKDFDLDQLARVAEGMTGAEIESAFVEALYVAFEQGREPTDLDIAQVLTGSVPLSKLMAEQVNGLRAWAKGRARLATSAAISGVKARKITA